MKGKHFLISAVLFPAVLSACAVLTDLMNMDVPGIRFFHPDREYLAAGDIGDIRVGFSAEMRRTVTEEAFSLRLDSQPVPGTFSWRERGRTLVFTPLAPPREGCAYTVSVSALAEDRYGNSLGKDFSRTFHTRKESESPRVVSMSPAPGTLTSLPREPVRVGFSEPMDRSKTEGCFSMSPDLRGFFSWSGTSDALTWQPLEDYTAGWDYRVVLGREARDVSGNPLPEECSFRFSVPLKNLGVIDVRTVSGGLVLTETPEGILFDPSLLIEKDEEFHIIFSSGAGPEDRISAVSILPDTPYSVRWENDNGEVFLSFPENLLWDVLYELRVLDRRYRFRVNGEGSAPLDLSRIVYIEDTLAGSPVRYELVLTGTYPFPSCTDAAFDIYISHGIGARIVLASFLSDFSAEPGAGCLDIHPRRVETNPVLPPPLPKPGPDETVFSVHCEVLSLPSPGTLSLRLSTDLRDLRENRLRESRILTVNKP